MQLSVRFHSLRSLRYLHLRVSVTWRFHRTEEISASLHITHILLAISANLGRDTDHNSTKLVFAHPLPEPLENEIKKSTSKQYRVSAFVAGYLGFPSTASPPVCVSAVLWYSAR